MRRVATMVARGGPYDRLFAAVTAEAGRLLGVEYAEIGRYEPDGTFMVMGAWSSGGAETLAVGSRWALGGKNIITAVSQTASSARLDDYSDASGPLGLSAQQKGVNSVVATPVTVEGELWGAVIVGTRQERPLPPDTEARLTSFLELVGIAIANAESHAQLAQLAQEQAALRRVATLVARGAPQDELFAAVTEGVGQLLPVEYTYMGRYEPDETLTIVAACGEAGDQFRPGQRRKLGGKNLVTHVFQTGRSARVNSLHDVTGPLGVAARESGFRSAVGSPIHCEGGLWGVVIAGTTSDEPLAPDSEARLSQFTALVTTAIANTESRAALAASRARIVAAADEGRRKLERDLHDGAQQRLVHAVIVLKLALAALPPDAREARELLVEALQHAEQANFELRELAHGILPAALTRGGLRAGVEALVSRFSLPVVVDVQVERLPTLVEATAYFVVSEALTNAMKHAQAASVRVTVRAIDGELQVEIVDDGIGGALASHGSGLEGLQDRVAAVYGQLVVKSPPGGGTSVRALLPLPQDGQDPGESRR